MKEDNAVLEGKLKILHDMRVFNSGAMAQLIAQNDEVIKHIKDIEEQVKKRDTK